MRLCDGCNVRAPWEHRCHGATVCDCPECREIEAMTPEQIEAALAEPDEQHDAQVIPFPLPDGSVRIRIDFLRDTLAPLLEADGFATALWADRDTNPAGGSG